MSDSLLQRWVYRELEVVQPSTSLQAGGITVPEPVPTLPPGLTEAEVATRIASALVEAERRWAAEAEQQANQLRAQIKASLEAFAAERARYQREVETEAVKLALSLARKILRREAQADPQILHGLVRTALDSLGAGTTVRLRVAPRDVTLWQNAEVLVSSPFACELVSDPSLAAGDCIVETDLGKASLGLETQLQVLETAVLDVLEVPSQHAEVCRNAPDSLEQSSANPSLELESEAA